MQEQLENELKRRHKIEEALKQSGAPAEILRIVTGNYPLPVSYLSILSYNISWQSKDASNLSWTLKKNSVPIFVKRPPIDLTASVV